MASTLIFRAPQSIASPLPGTPKLRIRGDAAAITSDAFATGSAAALTSRTSDALLGGDKLAYTFLNPGAWSIASGQLRRGTAEGNATAMVELPATRSPDVTASCVLHVLPAASSPRLYLTVRRDNPTGSPQSQVRLAINEAAMTLNLYIGGVSETVSGSNTGIAAGDTVGIREYNGLVQMIRNGAVVKEFRYPAGQFTGDWAGFASGGTETFSVDDFLITETIR